MTDRTGADDFVREGATAPDFDARARVTVEGGTIDPLAVLDGLEAPPAPEELEKRLRTVAAALDGADPLRRAMVRERLVKRLEELGVRSPAMVADAALGRAGEHEFQGGPLQGRPLVLVDPQPWSEPVDGAEVASELEQTVRDRIVLPKGADTAITLWTFHTYAHEEAETSPYLGVKSPTRRCGKTRVLTVLAGTARRPLALASISPAALYRTVEKFSPTLLVDEGDTFLANSDELRGLLNSGHTRQTAWAVRTVGDDHEVRLFSTWCPKAIAVIGKLPTTLEDRSIVIPMRRKAKGESVKRVRQDRLVGELEPLRRKLARWAADHRARLRTVDPGAPDELDDRAADNWRPLLAIADCLGGPWPERAREAARLLSGGESRVEDEPRVQLLSDLRIVFNESKADKLPSAIICEKLAALLDRPWSEWGRRAKPIAPNQLANLLKPFGIHPKGLRMGDKTPKGYDLNDLRDPFSRYLPDPQHPQQTNSDADMGPDFDPQHASDVADRKTSVSADHHDDVADVAARNLGFAGWGRI